MEQYDEVLGHEIQKYYFWN